MNISNRANRRVDYAHAFIGAVVMNLIGEYMRDHTSWSNLGPGHRLASRVLATAVAALLFVLPTLYLRRRYLKVESQHEGEGQRRIA